MVVTNAASGDRGHDRCKAEIGYVGSVHYPYCDTHRHQVLAKSIGHSDHKVACYRPVCHTDVIRTDHIGLSQPVNLVDTWCRLANAPFCAQPLDLT